MPRGERCQSKGILLPQDLIGDGHTELWPGMFQAEAGRGDTASVRSTRDALSDTVASHAISDKQWARKNALDNRHGTACRFYWSVYCSLRSMSAPRSS